MSGYATPTRIAFALAVFLGSLTVVAWRQGQALTVMSDVDRLHGELSLARAENDAVRRSIERLEGLSSVKERAGERLGMRIPDASEQRIIPGGAR